MPTVRSPAVAGSFYESSPQRLRTSLESCFLHRLGPGALPTPAAAGPRRILGLVCPHAGFVYSGPAAAFAYAALAADGRPDTAILLGTNHHLLGPPISLDSAGHWRTPLGEIPVDTELRARLAASDLVEVDDRAHEEEHSIEVQLPWLQFIYRATVAICPILLGRLDRKAVHAFAQLLAGELSARNVVVIASSDFSHYVRREVARKIDQVALEQIAALEPDGLLEIVAAMGISMCGAMPVATMLAACKELGATKGRTLTYYTSGDITGETASVVGYAAVTIEK